jgi:hypothetical protein
MCDRSQHSLRDVGSLGRNVPPLQMIRHLHAAG